MSHWESAGQSDEWYTPPHLFQAMNVRFDLDAAAPPEGPRYVPADAWISKCDRDGGHWWPVGAFLFLNPPFGGRNGVRPWLERFVTHANGVCLVPDRTSAPWFQWAAPKMDLILFVTPKIKFERPDGSIGKSPGTGTALMAIGERGVAALRNARGLGWLARNAT